LTPSAYALLGLTAMVAALVTVLMFAMLKFAAAARETRRSLHGAGAETAFLSAALQEAVTKLKAQERANAARADASERLNGEIISSLTAGLVMVELNGDVRILNPAGRRMLDLPEAASTEPFERSARVQPLLDVIDESLKSGAPIVRRGVTLPENGHGVTHLGVTVSPLFDEQTLHGAICLFTDLKESLAAVGELTAGIAHEFRNSLATIQGYSKLFDLNALPPVYRPYVEGIRSETESLNQVVTNFLTFARPAQLTLTRVSLKAIIDRAADEVRGDLRALGGDVEVSGDFGDLDGDEVLLRQAFSNLLRNAVEAATGGALPPRIQIQSELDRVQRVSKISVNDNGPGIAPALRERVFRPFFTTKRSGTGLGLALVQKIIVFHNGRVAIGTSPFGGASLIIALPLSE
jgi:signal transduction histidine kinase